MKNNFRFAGCLILFWCCFLTEGFGQRVSLKTNALLWGNLTPNISGEIILSKRTTLEGTVMYSPNGGPLDTRLRGFSADYRYWIAGRPFVRSFVGFSTGLTTYKIKSNRYIHSGDAANIGLVYGYVLPLKKHWNIEFLGGYGISIFREKKFKKEQFDSSAEYNVNGHRFLPVRVGISVGYVF